MKTTMETNSEIELKLHAEQ